MAGRLAGKVAIVTGGASGIGRATTKLLVAEGAKVTIADFAKDIGADLAKELGDKNCLFVFTDVSNEQDVRACVKATIDKFGGVDCLVNCAASGSPREPIEDISVEGYQTGMNIMLMGPFLFLKHVVPHFKKQGHGAVVSIISLAGFFGVGANVVYTIAKHGLVGLTRGAADHLAPFNIRVNAVAPGWTMTPRTEKMFMHVDAEKRPQAMREAFAKKQPLQRGGEGEDIAEAVLYLLSDSARFVTGHTMVVDGGLSAVTRAFDEIGPL